MSPLPLREELRLKRFGFEGFTDSDFKNSKWGVGGKRFLAYRVLTFAYWGVFFAIDFGFNQNKAAFCLYLSHWNEAQLCLYFGFALVSLVCGKSSDPLTSSSSSSFSSGGSRSSSERSSRLYAKEEDVLCDGECAEGLNDEEKEDTPSTVQLKTTLQLSRRSIPSAVTKRSSIRWYQKLTTMLYVTSLSISLAVTLLYATFEMRTQLAGSEKQMSVMNFHLHFVNSLLIVIDFVVSRIPFRLLHFVYVSIFTAIYCIFLFILHVTGVNSAMYRIVDWKNTTSWAVGFCFGMTFLIAPTTHAAMHFVQRGVWAVSRRLVPPQCETVAVECDSKVAESDELPVLKA